MRDTILCLCDLTGVMARPWVEHGYQAVLVDPQHGCDHEDGAYLKLDCGIPRLPGQRLCHGGAGAHQLRRCMGIEQ